MRAVLEKSVVRRVALENPYAYFEFLQMQRHGIAILHFIVNFIHNALQVSEIFLVPIQMQNEILHLDKYK